jgi:hypothetical protein
MVAIATRREVAADQIGDPLCGPDWARETWRFGPMREQARDLSGSRAPDDRKDGAGRLGSLIAAAPISSTTAEVPDRRLESTPTLRVRFVGPDCKRNVPTEASWDLGEAVEFVRTSTRSTDGTLTGDEFGKSFVPRPVRGL